MERACFRICAPKVPSPLWGGDLGVGVALALEMKTRAIRSQTSTTPTPSSLREADPPHKGEGKARFIRAFNKWPNRHAGMAA